MTETQNVSRQRITIAIMALGGQGGGVLADWIIALAERENYTAQGTSVPGVAQRTGATIYYIELFPKSGQAPVLALSPMPGDVDILIAAELMESFLKQTQATQPCFEAKKEKQANGQMQARADQRHVRPGPAAMFGNDPHQGRGRQQPADEKPAQRQGQHAHQVRQTCACLLGLDLEQTAPRLDVEGE